MIERERFMTTLRPLVLLTCLLVAGSPTAVAGAGPTAPAPASLERASLGGKYVQLLATVEIPEDAGEYGEFKDFGYWKGGRYKGRTGLPAGYWVYVAPTWFIWAAEGARQVARPVAPLPAEPTVTAPPPEPEESLLARASVGGKYSGLIGTFHFPDYHGGKSNFSDSGFWKGGAYRGVKGLPPSYWVYVRPHWYLWERMGDQAAAPAPAAPAALPPPGPPASVAASAVLTRPGGLIAEVEVPSPPAPPLPPMAQIDPCPVLPAPPVTPPNGRFSVAGRLLLPGMGLPLGGADVVLEDAAGRVLGRTRSDGCGRYEIHTPGEAARIRYQVRTLKGSVAVSIPRVPVPAAPAAPAPPPLPGMPLGPAAEVEQVHRVDTSGMRVAVVEGRYDHVERILDQMGIRYELMSRQQLAKADLSRLAIVFVNCGDKTASSAEVANLRGFVEAGGALYLSDLELPIIQQAWPATVDGAKQETPPGVVAADVLDADLRSYLRGHPRITVDYDLVGRRHVQYTYSGAKVLLRADSGEPQMVIFPSGRGLVGYTTFHHSAQLNEAMRYSLVYLISRL